MFQISLLLLLLLLLLLRKYNSAAPFQAVTITILTFSFHKTSLLFILSLPEGRAGEAWEPSN